MPPKQREVPTEIDEELCKTLDAICEQQGLESREAAMEFLIRRRVRRGAQGITGRGRALYGIKGAM